MLTCIDVFSKYAWAIPLKNKSSKSVVAAFEHLFGDRRPANLQTDKGTEFLNAPTQELLKKNRINFYTTENDDVKASVVERFNRTLKTKMWKYFTFKGTHRYVDVLNDLLHSYNNTFHRTIKMSPSEVNRNNESDIRKTINKPKEKPKWLLKLGDRVRISKTRRQFKKGYLPNWSDELFTVAVRHPTDPPTYEIDDYDKERVKGKFYELELQKVSKADDVYKVESIFKNEKKKRKERILRKVVRLSRKIQFLGIRYKNDMTEETFRIPSIDGEHSTRSNWNVFGSKIPKEEFTFFAQVVLIYIVCITCIINLSIGNGNSNLWTSLLSGSLGYILPSPKLRKHVAVLPHSPQ